MQKRSIIRRQAVYHVEILETKLLLTGTYPLTAIPALNSDPGAPCTLYLDFHGEPAGSWGGTSVPATPAYDTDGDPTTFTAQELQNIQEIWASVSEAFSPFNVNVTTVDPGNWSTGGHSQLREIIGGNGSWTDTTEGGTAYIGSYTQPGLPDTVYVFPAELSNGNPQYVADDAVHEAGHAFGLYHQSVYSGTTLVEVYNPGNGVTAPFMGDPLSSGIRATWWDGQSQLGYNVIQDDMSVISNGLNGFGYRTLTVGQTAETATPLSISDDSISGSGIIESTTQTDYYSFTTGAGTDTFTVNVAEYDPMLQAKLQLYDSSGDLLATAADANTLGQTITANLTAGTYYLVVESYGAYGDVGQYTLSGTVLQQTGQPSNPTLTLSGAASVNEQAAYTLNLSASDPGQTISAWTINWGDGDTQTVSGNPSSVTHTFATGPNNYTISATATDGTGTYSAGNTVSVSVLHVPPTLSISGASSVIQGALYTLLLGGSDLHTILAWSINWGDGTGTQSVSGNPSSVTHTYTSSAGTYTIQATATDNDGTYPAGNTQSVSVVAPPTLAISGAASVNEEASYTLNLSASDPGQTISSWDINWGDGNLETVDGDPSSVNHTYATGPNSYTISATATDGNGTYSAGDTVAVSVLHVPPTLSISGASSVNQGAVYTLSLSGSDLHTIVSWSINWGDGDTQSVSGDPSSVTHTYAIGPNTYTIQATATDNDGTYSAGNTKAVSVLYVAPTLAISGAASVNEGSTYTLDLSASDPGHTISSWDINWGDGTATQTVSGNPSSVTHVYMTAPLTTTITANASDDQGTHSAGNAVSVTVNAVPVAIALSAASYVNQGSPFSLTLASVLDVGQTPSSFIIHWGDGTSNTVSALGTYAHVYSAPGTDNLSVDVVDGNGTHADVGSLGVGVVAVPFTVNISGPVAIATGDVYTLVLAASEPLNETVSQWTINWGDGSAAQTVSGNPSSATYTYANPGNYVISASAINGQGSATSNTWAVEVQSGLAFSISGPTSATVGAPYTLSLISTAPSGTVASWTIDWGDGTVQTVTGNPSSVTDTFTTPSPQNIITATASDTAGNTYASTSSQIVTVVAPPDTTPPAASGSFANLSAGGQSSYTFQVTYSDNVAVDSSTLGNGNVVVTGPNGYLQDATLVSVSGNTSTLIATYSITPPDGIWSSADSGTYSVTIHAGSVTDTSGNAVPAGTIGTFQVSVPPSLGSLGTNTRATTSSTLGAGDQALHTLTLTQPQVVTFTFTGQLAGFDVSVTDASGNVVLSRTARAFTSAVTLAPGTYTINVSFAGKKASKYTLTATVRAVPARISAAASASPGTQNSDWFTLVKPQTVTISLKATGTVNVQLVDINGNVLFNQSGAKFSSKLTLAAGSYYIQVSYAGEIVSRYLVSTTNGPVSAAHKPA